MAKGNAGTRRAGGGIGSRVNVSPGVRRGAPATGVRPAAVSQFGSSIGNKATDAGKLPYRGEKYATATPISAPLGNAKALDVGKGGVGTGRKLYGQSGTQGCHGPVAGQPKPQGREILREFGPDSSAVRKR
jgi:hypothetical protein